MNYNDFKKQIVGLVSEQVPHDTTVELVSVLKENGVYRDGLLIRYPEMSISPTVYLEEVFERVQKGMTMFKAAREIVSQSQKQTPFTPDVVANISDYNFACSRIFPKLINKEQNLDLLADVPYVEMTDLAIVCYLVVYESEGTHSSALVHHSLLECWEINEEELFAQAYCNSAEFTPACCSSLYELLCNNLPESRMPEAPEDFEDPLTFYIMTNDEGFFGAACILQENALKNFADKVQDDVIIVPSSIHEVLLAPLNSAPDIAAFNDMVAEVNEEAVLVTERLSNHIYIYRREGRYLCLPDDESIRFFL